MKQNINISGLVQFFTQKYWYGFWILSVLVIVGLVVTILPSVQIVKGLWQPVVITIPSAGARINFQHYEQALLRIEQGNTYMAAQSQVADPFWVSTQEPENQ